MDIAFSKNSIQPCQDKSQSEKNNSHHTSKFLRGKEKILRGKENFLRRTQILQSESQLWVENTGEEN